jgi:hypothetical protein
MRRFVLLSVAGLFLLTVACGCSDSGNKVETPSKQLELPKEGPKPAGGARPPSAQ